MCEVRFNWLAAEIPYIRTLWKECRKMKGDERLGILRACLGFSPIYLRISIVLLYAWSIDQQ